MSNQIIIPGNPGDVSDGYHTFSELYSHRHILFINLVLHNKGKAFKTRKNDKGEQMESWFILGIDSKFGQITYHLPEEYWNMANVKEVEYNKDYDGHDSDNVIQRLTAMATLQF